MHHSEALIQITGGREAHMYKLVQPHKPVFTISKAVRTAWTAVMGEEHRVEGQH